MPMADDANNDDTTAEEQASHHVKLHEYCSTDVDNMVQRHIHLAPFSQSLHFGH
ncbi:uncharacterized protein FOMMEDRAFT_154963 [Fomitiporia mediterranea MF3/22]|uniref:uncharacterized protein n=1 Tax=Fomitiporia mediterranea (strain MF3/22) TaxID=694068 RepID=UPI0004409BC7|nr:uncharacterized protein FOMMEDRAFT_154963 [Fomitiporia mediterranea MF3/22]EJD03846.1 hypothetical protein FOMMEDRAFT_154963 [Fomitiporia mediterranea MF3/22]